MRRWMPLLLLIGSGIAVYANSFHGVLLFDDEPHIVNNEKLRSLWPPWEILATRRPVVTISLAINYAWHRLEPWGYHLVNLTIHILAGLTLYGLARRTLGKPSITGTPPCETGDKGASAGGTPPLTPAAGRNVALAIALIWLVHPLQTQSVTYIIQRGESLMGLFYFLVLYCLARGADSRQPMPWYACAIAACALGMGSKAVMISAPIVAVLYDRTFLAGSFARAVRRRWHVHACLGLTWSVLFACGVVQGTLRSNPNVLATMGLGYTHCTPWQYLATQPGVLLHYIRLSFWPTSLCLDYSWPVATTTADVLLPALIVAALLIATVWAILTRKRAGFLGAAFFLVLAPTSSVIPIKDACFEHRMYVPLASIVALVVVAAYHRFGCHPYLTGKKAAAGFALLAVVCGALGYRTTQRNRVYRSQLAMWQDVARKQPDSNRAQLGVGSALHREGRVAEAVEAFRRAIAINPAYSDAHHNLGVALTSVGHDDEAVAAYRRAIELNPHRVETIIKLGELLGRQARHREAIRLYRQAIRIHPQDADLQYALGNALADQGDFDPALAAFRKAIELNPRHVSAHVNLGKELQRRQDFAGAVAVLRRAVDIAPAQAMTRLSLGVALMRLHRWQEAEFHMAEAARLAPSWAEVHFRTGVLYLMQKRWDDAVQALERAVKLDPHHQQAMQRLQRLRAAHTGG